MLGIVGSESAARLRRAEMPRFATVLLMIAAALRLDPAIALGAMVLFATRRFMLP